MKKRFLILMLIMCVCFSSVSCESVSVKEELSRAYSELEQKNEEIKRLEEELSKLNDDLRRENELVSELKRNIIEQKERAEKFESGLNDEKEIAGKLEESLKSEKEISERLKGILSGEIKNPEKYELPVIYLPFPEPDLPNNTTHYDFYIRFDSPDEYLKAVLYKDFSLGDIMTLEKMFKKTEFGYMLADPVSIISPINLEKKYDIYNLDVNTNGGYTIRYIMDKTRRFYSEEDDIRSGTVLFTRETEASYKSFLKKFNSENVREFTDNGFKYTVYEEYAQTSADTFHKHVIEEDDLNDKYPLIVKAAVATDSGYYSLKYFYPDKFITKEELTDIFSFLNK